MGWPCSTRSAPSAPIATRGGELRGPEHALLAAPRDVPLSGGEVCRAERVQTAGSSRWASSFRRGGRTMRRSGWCAALSIAALLVASTAVPALGQQPPIKIGVAGDLSGAAASIGQAWADAIKMGADEINAGGGILGRKVALSIRDTEFKVDVGVREAKDLVLREKVNFLLGGISSGVSLAMSTSVSKEYKVIQITAVANTHRADRGALPALLLPGRSQHLHGGTGRRHRGRQAAGVEELLHHRVRLRVRPHASGRVRRHHQEAAPRREDRRAALAARGRDRLHALHHQHPGRQARRRLQQPLRGRTGGLREAGPSLWLLPEDQVRELRRRQQHDGRARDAGRGPRLHARRVLLREHAGDEEVHREPSISATSTIP